MSKAIELAKECNVLAGYEGEPEFLETYFRRAQAMALRDAIYQFELPWGLAKDLYIARLHRIADELAAGK